MTSRSIKGIASKRLIAVLVAVFVFIGFATARSMAAGDGYSAPDRGTIGFTPSSNSLNVKADSGHLIGLTWVEANKPIRLANGSMSPSDTYYLRFEALTADNVVITQNVNGRSVLLANRNSGDPNTEARLGAEGATTDVWTGVSSLDLCVTAQTFYTIINSYSGAFGGSLASVTGLVAQIFGPLAASPFGNAGPCIGLVKLLPLLAAIVQAGVPLPRDLPAKNIDINVSAANIAAPAGVQSLLLPVARIEVDNA
ncbi:MAG: hypothetical protein LLG14_19770 [Nocardiaceae bacterium]|nr:hypothetical protein [Nocardiaceae bacterium]